MGGDTFTKESFWAELEKIGEDAVRIRVVTQAYGKVGPKLALAEEWLRRKDQERREASDALSMASSREANRIARSAKNAAWIAATAAIIAAICAMVAILPHSSK